jgi:DNA-binding transcriptional MocR family regulator
MWCVPKYSNPCGVVYSDESVMECISLLKQSSPHFTIFWDNAYGIHDFDPINPTPLLPIMKHAEDMHVQDKIALFCSTSKITYAGGGLAGIGLSAEMKSLFLKHVGVMSIGPDKLAQQKHMQLFSEPGSLTAHMKAHAALITPKFDAVLDIFADRLQNTPGVSWSKPKGGYFISLYTPRGTAKKICAAARDKGIVLTQAGSAYPYGKDPEDAHLRIAPTYPSLEDVTYAAKIICDAINEVVESTQAAS